MIANKKYASTFIIAGLSIASLVGLTACTTTQKQASTKTQDKELTQAAVTPTESRAPGSQAPVVETPHEVIDANFIRQQADYHFSLAEAYGLDGEVQRAIDEYKLTLVYDPQSPQVRLKLAGELVKKGELVQAVDQAESAVQIDPSMNEARLLLGGLYSSSKLYDKALEQYRAVVANDADNIEASLYIGALLAEEKKYDESVKHFKKTAMNKKYAHLAYYYWGRIELERKNDKMAEEVFKKSLDAHPEFLESVVALGYLYEQSERVDAAVKLYKNYQDKFGPSAKIANSLGRIYMERDQYAEAYGQFEVLAEQEPDNLNVKVKMALILIEEKNYDRAIHKLKDILAVAPDSEKIRFYLAAVYEEVKAYPEAIHEFQAIKPASNMFAEAVIHTAYLQKLSSDYASAVATMSSAISNRSDVPQFYSFYASLLDDQKQPTKAVEILKGAVAKFPKDDQLYFYLGSMQDKSGLKEASVVTMRKVLELNPDHIQALNYLGYTLTEMNTHLDEAETLIRHALKLKPNDGYITDSLGWVLFRRGQFKEAISTLEGAYKLKPDESIIAEHLGDAYLGYSLPDKARQMYTRAVTLESDESNILKIKQKIANIDNTLQPNRSQSARGLTPTSRDPASDSSADSQDAH